MVDDFKNLAKNNPNTLCNKTTKKILTNVNKLLKN